MIELGLLFTALTHTMYGALRRQLHPADRGVDRGAVSLEQVLWFVAAGVSVVVISAIVWGKIKGEANKPIDAPQAP